MTKIYKITNIVNGKSYIGKTERSIESRFQDHIYESKKIRSEKRPLYSAINKYGIGNFKIELIEETKKSEEREIYYIEKYKTYGSNGYNATIGGDGKSWLDHNAIIECYKKEQNMTTVANIIGCHICSVRQILNNNNIEIKLNPFQKKIYCKNESMYKVFNNIQDAIDWLITNKITKSKNRDSIRGSIGRALNGKRKSYLGMEWKYNEE